MASSFHHLTTITTTITILAVALALAACGSSDDAPAAPPYNALFDTLPAATPSKLRGVWAFDQANAAEGSAQLRFKFSEASVLAGIKCTYTRPGFDPVIAGQESAAEITGLDEAKGTFTPAQSLTFLAKPDARVCEGQFAKEAYDFTIQDNTLTFTTKGKLGTIVLQKVGD